MNDFDFMQHLISVRQHLAALSQLPQAKTNKHVLLALQDVHQALMLEAQNNLSESIHNG